MGLFGAELQTAITGMGWNQRIMVEKARAFSQSQLSRYISGTNLPETYTLEALCSVFTEELRERLVTAYLVDQIPPSARNLVEVRPTGARSGEEVPTRGKAPKGSRLQRNLAEIERLVMDDANLERAVDYFVRSFKGLPLHEEGDKDDDEVKIEVPAKEPGKQKGGRTKPQS